MCKKVLALVAMLFSVGCASTHYYKEDGKTELPGLPFVWKDEKGKAQRAYVKRSLPRPVFLLSPRLLLPTYLIQTSNLIGCASP